MKSSKQFFTVLMPLLIIAVIVLAAFGRTLGSYFLEDDFGEIHYVSQIFAGNWQQLVSNFTGNYMQLPTIKAYRPVLLLSIMSDYALWGTNACGYFITNIIFAIAAAVMLYMVLRQLTKSWSLTRSITFSLLSAALFATSPLHCESVSLMVGRVDIICSFFFLLALWAFICKGSRANLKLLLLGLASFWAALLTKEMAIGLPVVLTAICFFCPESLTKQAQAIEVFSEEKKTENIYNRLKLSLLVTYPTWISLLLYFALRRLVLGTFTGGYIGSVGAQQVKHIFEKWTDPDTITRIIFPLNQAVFGDHCIYHSLLSLIYFVLLVLIILRIIVLGIPRVWLALLAVWGITALLPIYQLWGLGYNLEGARFLFFLTIPLAALLPALLFAPVTGESRPVDVFAAAQKGQRQLPIAITATMVLSLLVILQVKVAAKNNIPWVHAGKQTSALLREGQKLAQRLGPRQKAIVLGIPGQIDGAHVIYNGLTFNFLLAPPFYREDMADRIITFSPILFGNADLINTQRFKQELLRTDLLGCYVWRQDKLTFEQMENLRKAPLAEAAAPFIIPLPQQKNILFPFNQQSGLWEATKDGVSIAQCEKGAGFVVGPIDINPLAYDFIDITATIKPSVTSRQITAFWQGTCTDDKQCPEIKAEALEQSQIQPPFKEMYRSPIKQCHYRIALSRYWRWFTEGAIKRLGIEMPPAESIIIRNISLWSDAHIVPRLAVVAQQSDNTGVYSMGQKGLVLQVDANQVDNCAMIKLQFSKPNYFFDNFTTAHQYAIGQDAVLTSMIVHGCSGKNIISSQLFPASAYYQVRAIALNKDGASAGEWSDPLTINFDAARP